MTGETEAKHRERTGHRTQRTLQPGKWYCTENDCGAGNLEDHQ